MRKNKKQKKTIMNKKEKYITMTHQNQYKACIHNYWQFRQYTPHGARKTTIDKIGRKGEQSP